MRLLSFPINIANRCSLADGWGAVEKNLALPFITPENPVSAHSEPAGRGFFLILTAYYQNQKLLMQMPAAVPSSGTRLEGARNDH